jgi:hypothetical protein
MRHGEDGKVAVVVPNRFLGVALDLEIGVAIYVCLKIRVILHIF